MGGNGGGISRGIGGGWGKASDSADSSDTQNERQLGRPQNTSDDKRPKKAHLGEVIWALLRNKGSVTDTSSSDPWKYSTGP